MSDGFLRELGRQRHAEELAAAERDRLLRSAETPAKARAKATRRRPGLVARLRLALGIGGGGYLAGNR